MDVSRFLDTAPLGRFHVTLFAVSLAVMLLEGVDIQLIGFVAPLIVAEWEIPAADFSLVFSAGLAGAMVGAMLLGTLGDRLGRRPMILASLALFAVGTLATPLVTDVTGLVALRFATSLGLGGVVPNLLSLCAELAPGRVRAAFVGAVATGQLAGGVLGSVLSSWLLEDYGWRFMFVLAGGLSVLMLVPAWILLPESPRFILVAGRDPRPVRAVLNRLGRPDIDVAALTVERSIVGHVSIRDLFSGGRAAMTSYLWLAIGFNIFMTVFVIYWLPTLLGQLGVPLSTAILAVTSMNAAGIIGGIAVSVAINRFGPFGVLPVCYLLCAASVAVLGFAAPNVPAVMLLAFSAGFFGLGGFAGANLLSATLYPTELRSAGVGAAIAASKAGGIAGPLAAGAGLAAGVPLSGIFLISAAGGVLAAIAVGLLARTSKI